MKRVVLLVTVIFSLLCNLAESQPTNPGLPVYEGTYFEYPHLTSVPPLTTDMPYDVMIAYIAMDSVRRNADYYDFLDFIQRQTYNDTLRTIMKYYYKIVDWNPMLFYAYERNGDIGKIHPSFIIEEIINKYLQFAPTTAEYNLATASYVYRIIVTDTVRSFDTADVIYPRILTSQCRILDIFKGNIVDSPCSFGNNSISDAHQNPDKSNLSTLSDSVFCFDICLDWEMGESDDMVWTSYDGYSWTGIRPKMVDSLDIPWIKAFKEYIVFLSPVIIDSYADHSDYRLFPAGGRSLANGIYPIINGMIQDPSNDFGLGTSVPYPAFIQRMQQIIDKIKNYPN